MLHIDLHYYQSDKKIMFFKKNFKKNNQFNFFWDWNKIFFCECEVFFNLYFNASHVAAEAGEVCEFWVELRYIFVFPWTNSFYENSKKLDLFSIFIYLFIFRFCTTTLIPNEIRWNKFHQNWSCIIPTHGFQAKYFCCENMISRTCNISIMSWKLRRKFKQNRISSWIQNV
jgi:hypothetical protein